MSRIRTDSPAEHLTRAATRATISLVTTGAEQLRAWIKRSKLTNVAAAAYLAIPGIDDTVLNKILNAGRRPDLEKLFLIEAKTGVPVRSWLASDVDESEKAVAVRGGNRR